VTVDAAALGRAHYNATLVAVRAVHAELAILHVRPDAPLPHYEAGQWIAIGVGRWEAPAPGFQPDDAATDAPHVLLRRPFSISSSILVADGSRLLAAADETDYELYVALWRDTPRGSALPARLARLQPGSRLWVDDVPHGRNTLADVRPADDVLFVASGTGEAPHNRMILELLRRGHRGRIASVVTTRRRIDQAYRSVHERVAQLFDNYRYLPVATREVVEPGGRIQDLFTSGAMEERAGFRLDPARCRVFLCGGSDMIGAPRVANGERHYPTPPGMIELLERHRGFRADSPDGSVNIHFERE
jgi:ferredoxin--NADP+ reductase